MFYDQSVMDWIDLQLLSSYFLSVEATTGRSHHHFTSSLVFCLYYVIYYFKHL